MSEPKPIASLSPSLLARKGTARPAMRPQLTPLPQFQDTSPRQVEDDLGWNDMGADHDHHHDAHHHAPVTHHEPVAQPAPQAPAALPPSQPQAEVVGISQTPVPQAAPVPKVVQQQAEVAARVGATREATSRRRSALGEGRRAAFTLRLDAERHLKLRLACTIAGRSAQLLMTDALDRLISDLPDVDQLAAHVRKTR